MSIEHRLSINITSRTRGGVSSNSKQNAGSGCEVHVVLNEAVELSRAPKNVNEVYRQAVRC